MGVPKKLTDGNWHKPPPCRHARNWQLHSMTSQLICLQIHTCPLHSDDDDDDEYSVDFLGSGQCSPAVVEERAGLLSPGDYRVQCRHAIHWK